MVDTIGRVNINNPKGVKGGAKKTLVSGDVEGEDVIHPLELGVLSLGYCSFFSFFFLVIKSLLCLKVQKTHAALAMEIKNL